jgi:hypothetical protein
MALITSQKIGVYYERFKSIEVNFTKELIQVTNLVTNQVHLKCVSDVWPCVLYSSSFQGAKIVANIKSGLLQKLDHANNMVSVRFCFKNPDNPNPVAFFVTAKSVGYTSYGGSQDVALFTLQFTQRPPDDLIEIMGRILEANVNSSKRKEERIVITPDAARRLSLLAKESAIFIQGVPRRCILRDISFSNTKLIMMGVAKFLVNKDAAIRLDFDDPRESFLLKGKFTSAEVVEGRKDLVALEVRYEESQIPMGYKLRINDYLVQVRAGERGNEESRTVAAPEPVEKAPSPAPEAPPAESPEAASAVPAPAGIAPAETAPEPDKAGAKGR